MTLEDVLKMPDAEILRSGIAVMVIAREYRRLTGLQPDACDCQTKNYIRLVRLKHKEA
ncbi:MAG: hypothetical protein PHG64_15505 [Paludibacter sp.]|nr:hypothetical protein [Paludibacter sp.]